MIEDISKNKNFLSIENKAPNQRILNLASNKHIFILFPLCFFIEKKKKKTVASTSLRTPEIEKEEKRRKKKKKIQEEKIHIIIIYQLSIEQNKNDYLTKSGRRGKERRK